jgi:hypothetical protein
MNTAEIGPDQEDIDRAWAQEAERRIDAIESGKDQLISADDVFKSLEPRRN